uniref:F-box domain-containing protein n=1 Tax=Setaria italica TaxID=4555 RepID=K3ZC08_SETIT
MLDETPAKKPRLCSAGDTSCGDAAAAASPVDRLSALPDAMLHHVMSFLRAWEVARTCGFAKFVYRFLLEREESAPVDTLQLLSSPACGDPYWRLPSPSCDGDRVDYSSDDVDMWIHAAIKRKARVIQLARHPKEEDCPQFERVSIASRHLKHLIFIQENLTIAAPNLLSLCCVKLYFRVPLFQNMGSIATATIVLDDSLHVGYEHEPKLTHDDASTCEYNEVLSDNEDEQSDDHGQGQDRCKHCKCNGDPYWIKRGYGRRNGFGDDKILGGHNVLHSLSNATSLKLLADAGEVILNRELKARPVFSNLKTLSLGEWCMAADFDPVVFFLQHSPNLERLFLELKLVKEEMEDNTRLVGRSFVCAHLKLVKIKCSEYETRVHLLAELFKANDVPVEKIYHEALKPDGGSHAGTAVLDVYMSCHVRCDDLVYLCGQETAALFLKKNGAKLTDDMPADLFGMAVL